jgi:hypothetical protein
VEMCHLAHPKLLLHRFRVLALFFGEWDADAVEEKPPSIRCHDG